MDADRRRRAIRRRRWRVLWAYCFLAALGVVLGAIGMALILWLAPGLYGR